MQRTLAATAPDELWVGDSTYVPTEQEGFLYLAVILDVFSRRVIGWSMVEHLRAELVLSALDMAVGNRHPGPGLLHHWIMAGGIVQTPVPRLLAQVGSVSGRPEMGRIQQVESDEARRIHQW